MDKLHFDVLGFILNTCNGKSERHISDMLKQGIILGVTEANHIGVLTYLYKSKMIESASDSVTVTDIGKSHYSQERERRDFEESIRKAQKDLNISQISTNFYVKCTSIAMAFFTFGLLAIAWCDFRKENNKPCHTQEQSNIKKESPILFYPTDTTGNGTPTLSDSLGVSQ